MKLDFNNDGRGEQLDIIKAGTKKIYKFCIKREREMTPKLEWSHEMGKRGLKSEALFTVVYTRDDAYRMVCYIPKAWKLDNETTNDVYEYVLATFNETLVELQGEAA